MEVIVSTRLEESHLDCLVESFPEVVFHVGVRDRMPDGALGAARVLFCDGVTSEMLHAMISVEWLHCRSAGVDHLPLEVIRERGIQLTNGRGAHGVPVSETVLAMMLAFGTGLHEFVKAQKERAWIRPSVVPGRFELEGQTLLVIGLGHVGATLAK